MRGFDGVEMRLACNSEIWGGAGVNDEGIWKERRGN